MQMLHNRKTIVTGAAQGIGRAIVDRFIQEGASVLAIDIKAMESLKSDYPRSAALTCLQLDCDSPNGLFAFHKVDFQYALCAFRMWCEALSFSIPLGVPFG